MIVTRSPDVVSIDVNKLLALGRTLIRSRLDAVVLLTGAATVAWAVVSLTGLWQLAAVWLAAELVFFAYQRWR